MRREIRAQNVRYLVLGSALLSLVFAACSLNPQPIPPGAQAGLNDGGFATTPSPSLNGEADSETGSAKSDAGRDSDADPSAFTDGGVPLDSSDADAGETPDARDGGDAAFDGSDGTTGD